MSVKTTHQVTRDFAIQAILSKIYNLSDEQLADMLESAIHNGYYNFEVVDEIDYSGMPYLDDITNLPEYNDAW